jgi:hypothetical protein
MLFLILSSGEIRTKVSSVRSGGRASLRPGLIFLLKILYIFFLCIVSSCKALVVIVVCKDTDIFSGQLVALKRNSN